MIVHSKFILYAVFFKTKFQVILFIVGLLAIWQKGLKVRRIVEILFGKYSLVLLSTKVVVLLPAVDEVSSLFV